MPHRQRCIQHSYTYFRLSGGLKSLPRPYFVGHYGSVDPGWLSNSDFVIEQMGYAAVCLGGTGIMHVGTEECRCGAGDAYLCRWADPGAWHHSVGTEELRWVFMVFVGATALGVVEDMVRQYGPFYRVDTKSSLVYRMMTIARQPAHDTALTGSEGAALVWDLFRSLLASAEHASAPSSRLDLADAAARMVRERNLADLSVASIASSLDISREHLARVFSERYGQSLASYLAGVRMQEACALLRQSRTPVKQIAQRLGYATYPSFHRAFTRHVGITPGRYRGARR